MKTTKTEEITIEISARELDKILKDHFETMHPGFNNLGNHRYTFIGGELVAYKIKLSKIEVQK